MPQWQGHSIQGPQIRLTGLEAMLALDLTAVCILGMTLDIIKPKTAATIEQTRIGLCMTNTPTLNALTNGRTGCRAVALL